MELRQVRYFAAIARTGSFGIASDDLHVAKSALSTQVKTLEDELGVQLLVRGGGRRDVRLTAAGEAFFEEAVTILRAVDAATDRVRALADVASGTCRAVVQRGWETWSGWSVILTEFRRRHPGLVVKLSQGNSYDAMLETVANAEADIAVLGITDLTTLGAAGVDVEILHSEPVLLVLPPDHRLAGQDDVAFDELREESWLLPPIEHEAVAAATRPLGFEPRLDVEALTQEMARALVLAGEGIAIATVSEAGYFAPAPTVGLTGPALTMSVAVAYRSTHSGASARVMRDYLREVFAAAAATPELSMS